MNLRQAAQRALKEMDDHMYRADTHEFYEAKEALRTALAEPEQEPVAWVDPKWLDPDTRGWPSDSFASQPIEGWLPLYTAPTPQSKPQTTHWEGCEAVHPECRAKTELERKSDAIQRLWKERDELRSECRVLVRQNGEWQELNAGLVEALRRCRDMVGHPDNLAFIDAALANVEASNGS